MSIMIGIMEGFLSDLSGHGIAKGFQVEGIFPRSFFVQLVIVKNKLRFIAVTSFERATASSIRLHSFSQLLKAWYFTPTDVFQSRTCCPAVHYYLQ